MSGPTEVTQCAVVRERQSQHVPDTFLHAHAAGELSAAERGAVDRHVATCDACRARLARIEATVARMAVKPAEPSELAWRRIEKRVAEQLGDDAERRIERATRRDGRLVRRAIAAVASLAAATAIGIWIGRSIERAPDVTERVEVATPQGAAPTRAPTVERSAAPDRSAEIAEDVIELPRLEARALRELAGSDRDASITTPASEATTHAPERSIDYVGDRARATSERTTSYGQTRVEIEAPSDPLAALWLETTKAYYEARDIPRALSLAKRIVDEGGQRPEVALAEEILCDGYTVTRQARSAVAACQALLRRAEAAGLEERARAIHYQIGTLHRVELGDCAAAMYHYGRSVVFGRTSRFDDEALMWRVDCAIQLGDENSARRDLALLQRAVSTPGRRERLAALEARFEQMLEARAQPGDLPRGRSQPVDDTR
ncbi:zf-HC2 domain-containing protein [Myxococcota bacterium]|nr:zf-HC2 domain-containing protein [Myxococcota bacterium]